MHLSQLLHLGISGVSGTIVLFFACIFDVPELITGALENISKSCEVNKQDNTKLKVFSESVTSLSSFQCRVYCLTGATCRLAAFHKTLKTCQTSSMYPVDATTTEIDLDWMLYELRKEPSKSCYILAFYIYLLAYYMTFERSQESRNTF